MKLATPLETMTGSFVQRITPPGERAGAVRARVTLSVLSVVITLPEEPSTETLTEKGAPALILLGGSAVKASLAGVAGSSKTSAPFDSTAPTRTVVPSEEEATDRSSSNALPVRVARGVADVVQALSDVAL